MVENYLGKICVRFVLIFVIDCATGDICTKGDIYANTKLESVDAGGNIINSDHIIMQSVLTSCITYISKQLNLQLMDVYRQVYDGTKINFDLTEAGRTCGFKYEKEMFARSYEEREFTRCVGVNSET
jgi:hypothetical protein